MQIDLLAFAAWTQPRPARVRHERIGYEVKVARSDLKRELERPSKRSAAVAFCHEFYFATPVGLLKDDEKAWTPPPGLGVEWPPFARQHCPGAFGAPCYDGRLLHVGVVDRRTREERRRWTYVAKVDHERAYSPTCPTCRGVGWIAESDAVRAGAPRLWVPPDVGLVEVHDGGRVEVVRKAPVRQAREGYFEIEDRVLGDLVRWTSVRPDPRHAAELHPLRNPA